MSTVVGPSGSEYYGVFVPPEHRSEDEINIKYVFHVRQEALDCAKLHKKSRFKAFSNYIDADRFAQNGLDLTKLPAIDGDSKVETSVVIGEKQSPFKAPRSQELVKFRKCIETGDVDKVNNIMWDNPRYLVSSGDTPSILQEGSRYNALHIAAKAKNHEICDLILSTISDETFIKLLYGDSSYDQVLAKDRIKVLTDLYLNTPDKGLNETPLHFAVKFGAVEVVRALVSYPQCDKTLKNKYGKSPDMIICDRCDASDISMKKRQITLLLEGSYYVPVLRAEDNTVIPMIGEPFSPGRGPVLKEDPLSPRLEIRAYAGPLNRQEAEQFRRVWKTPPRHKPTSRCTSKEQVLAAIRYTDADKGLERLGNTLASKFKVEWKEYWPFLDSFVDLASEEGLQLFEDHLSARITDRSDTSKDMSELAHLLESCTLRSPKSEARTDDGCLIGSLGPVCHVEDVSDNNVDPLLCMVKACQVYATRLSNSILQVAGRPSGDIANLLRKEIVHVHSLINSYLDDVRFTSVDFRIVHNQLGKMTGQKIRDAASAEEVASLKEKLTALKTEFSNDNILNGSQDIDTVGSGEKHLDGGSVTALKSNGPFVSVVTCLLDKILNGLSPPRGLSWWSSKEKNDVSSIDLDDCSCDLRRYQSTGSQLFGRSHSFKRKPPPLFLDVRIRTASEQSVQPILDETDNLIKKPRDNDNSDVTEQPKPGDVSDESEENTDEFYTPPSSPEPEYDDPENDLQEFEDAKTLREDIFIEGDEPTKGDCEVYEALLYSNCIPSARAYPHVYKWYHAVSLYTNAERHRWQGNNAKKKDDSPDTSVMFEPFDVRSPTLPSPKILNSPVFRKPPLNQMNNQECQSPQLENLNSPKLRRTQSWFKVTGLNSPKASLKRRLI